MAVYAIGDIQGCYRQFRELLDKIQFNDRQDLLYLTGDIVNRGPDSLETLRFVVQNQICMKTVLGNHELHLLAASEGFMEPRTLDTFQDILAAPDREELLEWLRMQPMTVFERKLNVILVHAAVHPFWTQDELLQFADEVTQILRSEHYRELLRNLYGNKPRKWSKDLAGWKRIRFIINVLTRLRFVDYKGRLDFDHTGPPGTQAAGLLPWFKHPYRQQLLATIVFGHWSALGVYHDVGILGIDSGCCWGGQLSAVRMDLPEYEYFKVNCNKL